MESDRPPQPDAGDAAATGGRPGGRAGGGRGSGGQGTGGVGRFRDRLYHLLEAGGAGDRRVRWIDRLLVLLVFAAVGLVAIETVPELAEWGPAFRLAEFLIGLVFLVEYCARLWVADLHPPLRAYSPAGARLRYALQPSAIVDLFAVLPFLLAPLLDAEAAKLLVFLRLARFFKLARYSPALRSLIDAVVAERHAIGASFIIVFGVVMLAATVLYLVERSVQPEALGTIPDAMWWALTTVTTVGYGDVVPVTPLGKVVGGIVMLLGYGLFALPVGIVATAFAREIHSRDFAVTWSMVARVPLFQDLKAAEIAEIAKLLRSQAADAGDLLTRRGEPATSMYFIASGAVDLEMDGARLRLEEGAFFGEMALLGERHRLATAVAAADSQLLVLDAHDLHALMRRKPEVARRVLEEVRKTQAGPLGDLSRDELEQAGEAGLAGAERRGSPANVGVAADPGGATGPDLFAALSPEGAATDSPPRRGDRPKDDPGDPADR